jgi:hypothetical protein
MPKRLKEDMAILSNLCQLERRRRGLEVVEVWSKQSFGLKKNYMWKLLTSDDN